MKRTNFFLLVALLLTFYACMPEGDRVIGRPIFSARNTSTIEIDTIVLTDTNTVFHIKAIFTPNYWIRIDSKTYLQGGDKKYIISKGEGIELNKEFWMPESGEAYFKLIFPAIPRSLTTIDFIESDCEDCFKIYGIDLTGKAKFPNQPEGLPEELRNRTLAKNEKLQKPQMEVGKTTVNVHLLGYQKGMGAKNVNFYVNSFFPSGQTSYEAIIDETTGIASFEFQQYGVNYLMIDYMRSTGGSGYIFPGEHVDIYVDMQEQARQSSPFHQTEEKKQRAYSTSKGAKLNLAMQEQKAEYMFQTYSEEFHDTVAGMDIDTYFEYIMNEARRIENNIKAADISDMAKELFISDLNVSATSAILGAEYKLSSAHRIKNKIPWNQRNIDYKAPSPTTEQFKVLKAFNLNNSMLLYSSSFGSVYPAIFRNIKDLSIITDDKDGILFDLQKCYQFPYKITNLTPLTEKEKATLASIKNPFYAQACETMEKDMQAQLEAAKSKTGYTICEVPQVSNAKLFDAIAAKYKGKVVLVDFWATWCGPCISSIKAMEPIKDTELKQDDLCFVYLTGESSPEVKWRTTIADIKGDHYRLSKEQWDYVCGEFKIDGIPSYAIIQKDGTYKLRNDLRGTSQMKNALLKLVK